MSGLPLADPALAQRPAILAIIENNPIARPPSGLNLADLVIEAPVEGDTTRFAAIYLCSEPLGADVGPIRSLRYFNVDHFQQLRAVTFAFGGATQVLDAMNRNNVPYVNGLTAAWPFFYRAGPWPAPHNVFFDVDGARLELSSGALVGLAQVAGAPRGPFAFDPAAALPGGRAVTSIGLQTASFWQFGWQWDAASGLWLRTDAGAPNFDAVTGDRISARTVMVQEVEQEVLVNEPDPGGYPRRYQFLTGEGTGVLFVDGQAHDVRWSRPGPDDLTTWTYAEGGAPVVLPPGRVWWEIVPVGSAITEG
jgi:Protein of unknown function (DUF3048) N-terminal domain/Protein of unknown function (DUF3048) C-terminal domain